MPNTSSYSPKSSSTRAESELSVDPSLDMVQRVTKLLESMPDIHVVGSAANAEEAFARTTELHPDVVLMEITLPGRYDGMQAAQIITRR